MNGRYQFLRPFAFMTVAGPSLALYRLVWPLVASAATMALYLILPERIDLVGDKSAADYMS